MARSAPPVTRVGQLVVVVTGDIYQTKTLLKIMLLVCVTVIFIIAISEMLFNIGIEAESPRD